MMYNQDVIDNLVLTLKNSIETENFPQNLSDYDKGLVIGTHNTCIDVLNILGVSHTFQHIVVD